jgi:hypothetical protein
MATDRWTVVLLSIAAFFIVLALLARALPAASHVGSGPSPVLRKIYRTTVVETIAGGGGAGRTSVTQAVSGSVPSSTPAAATTRTS